jgi:hypothetical protein
MARNLIASKLIESVRNRAMIPDDITVYDDASILSILNEEIDVGLLNTLLTLHEEHLVTYTDKTPEDKRLVIPSRAVASKLRDLQRLSNGNIREMSRVTLEEISDYSSGYSDSNSDLFYVEGDEIVLLGDTTNSMRMYFHLRPNVIALESTCAQITVIDRTTGIIQFNTIPSAFTSLDNLDFIQDKSPNKILAFDIAVTSVTISTKSIIVDPLSIPKRLSVGDWVCPVETSPYANVPTEMHPLLAQRAAIYILEALGDNENLAAARGKLNQMETSIQKILDDRVEGAPRKIKSRHGFLVGSSGTVRRNKFGKGNY